MSDAGLSDVRDGDAGGPRRLHEDFDDFWAPFTLAVGPAGEHLRSLDDDQQAAVRDACRAALPGRPVHARRARLVRASGPAA